MDIFQFKVLYLLLQVICHIHGTVSGCCNDNYWCDGDPSFKLTPSASQGPFDSFVLIRWSSSNLDLAKCVDYFFIEYYEDIFGGKRSRRISPVNVERNKSLDNWKAAIDDLDINYIANISVKPNTQYVFTVFAIDKGAGWGELEGTARVSSGPIQFKTKAIQPITKPISKSSESELSQSIEKWVLYRFEKKLRKSTNAYEFLPDIWIRNGDRVQRYEEGKLYGMKKPIFEISDAISAETNDQLIHVNLTLLLTQMRTTYVWRSFFSAGVVTLYHTCGKKLPLGSFLESRILEDVESFLRKSNCLYFPVTVSLQIPRNITDIPYSSLNRWNGLKVLAYNLHLSRGAFEFDVPWLFSHFHNMSSLWNQQKVIVENQIMTKLEKLF